MKWKIVTMSKNIGGQHGITNNSLLSPYSYFPLCCMGIHMHGLLWILFTILKFACEKSDMTWITTLMLFWELPKQLKNTKSGGGKNPSRRGTIFSHGTLAKALKHLLRFYDGCLWSVELSVKFIEHIYYFSKYNLNS